MRPIPPFLPLLVRLLGLIPAGSLPPVCPPPPAVTPGSSGIGAFPLGGVDPFVDPGYRLQVVVLTWERGAYAPRHSHPTALVTCVHEGAPGFIVHVGAATLTRGATAATPEAAEPLAPNTEVVLGPRDCIAFDEFASHMEHTGWNADDGTTILWEARLLDPTQPFTTYVNDLGTPVP